MEYKDDNIRAKISYLPTQTVGEAVSNDAVIADVASNETGFEEVASNETTIAEPTQQQQKQIFSPKTPNSYKYPVLGAYYEFGPWISRNRRAICKGCQLSTSSSQPDRLLKHLRKCLGVTPEDKAVVDELMKERIRNKLMRNKNPQLGRKRRREADEEEDGSDYGYEGQDLVETYDVDLNSSQLSASFKKVKQELDRKSLIDDALTKFIVKNRIPLKAVHSPEFTHFISQLDPDYKLPPTGTITNVLIPRELKLV